MSLGTLPSGYAEADPSSLTININDGDNENPSPTTVNIDVQDSASMLLGDVNDDGNTDAGFIPKVGHVLAANTSLVVDGDQPLTADTTDDAAATDPPMFTYQWIRTNDGSTTVNDDDVAIEGATDSTYPLEDKDVGDTFTVWVWSSDNYGNGNGNANADAADSVVGENTNGFTLTPANNLPTEYAAAAYDEAEPFIIIGALEPAAQGDDRLEPGVDSRPRLVRFVLNYGQRRKETSSADLTRWVKPVEVMVDLNGPDCDGVSDPCVEADQS